MNNLNKRKIIISPLLIYDLIQCLGLYLILILIDQKRISGFNMDNISHILPGILLILVLRAIGKVYNQLWRYGGSGCYIRLIITDCIATAAFLLLEKLILNDVFSVTWILAYCSTNTVIALFLRFWYRFAYKHHVSDDKLGRFCRWLLNTFAMGRVKLNNGEEKKLIRVVIIGAGHAGLNLLDELLTDKNRIYKVVFFIDTDKSKQGRDIQGIPILPENEKTFTMMKNEEIQDVIFSIPDMDAADKLKVFELYSSHGFKLKVYEYPPLQIPGRKHELREFAIEDLLGREQLDILDDQSTDYYKNKVIMITGGGGSIGSEICRQLMKMKEKPKQLILVDIYENCAYDVQQGMLFAYKKATDIRVEICSVTNERGMDKIFETYHPEILIHAAAHKHVPLMEHNCVEAVENNVFGTLNIVRLCEKHKVGRFMMVSTDKAVNPTNVMGATKRVCEMITQAYSMQGNVICTATRFGNVLGSAGSVIPLFKRQIAAGGPVTVTDKRIIRYFMTIPEASKLVLQSGAMANNGELFVLDMGKPVRIWELAENMIKMSGVSGIDIVEVGLRPGEKLYEELIVDYDTMDKTENNLIFIEREAPVTLDLLEEKLQILKDACATGDDNVVRNALMRVVPSFKDPNQVNNRN